MLEFIENFFLFIIFVVALGWLLTRSSNHSSEAKQRKYEDFQREYTESRTKKGNSGGRWPWWRILGLANEHASEDEIKAAHRKLIKELHSDIHKKINKRREERLKRVNNAYTEAKEIIKSRNPQ